MKVIMEKQKRIALIAHDHLKDDLVRWCVANKDELPMLPAKANLSIWVLDTTPSHLLSDCTRDK